jgi:methionyl-tRNA formyltransferase
MKIVLCTSDFFSPVQDVIKQSGSTVHRVYTSCDLDTGFSDRTEAFAEEMRAEIRVGKVTEADIREFEKENVELLISAAYDYKVPIPSSSSLKFINVHGSLLPEGRGPWPQPWTLLKYPQHAGATFHTMTDKWDHGDIVLQQKIELTSNDNLNSYVAKTLVVVRELAEQLLANFSEIWKKKYTMEGPGSYWRKPQESDRTINVASATVNSAQDLKRAFGDFTLLYDPLSNETKQIKDFSAWEASHNYNPGEIVAISPPMIVYALKDGFASISF